MGPALAARLVAIQPARFWFSTCSILDRRSLGWSCSLLPKSESCVLDRGGRFWNASEGGHRASAPPGNAGGSDAGCKNEIFTQNYKEK